MIKSRVIETNEGIQGELTVDVFDRFSRNMRDKGWNNLDSVIKAGITGGNALEIGPGPGYLGLEWLKRAKGSTLTGCEISPDMIKLASRNAAEYALENSVRYVQANCMHMPFADRSFDAVFSNGSLHEWEDPKEVFDEICRVLKPGGLYCITDMRRDVNPMIRQLIYRSTKPEEIKPGFLSSLGASYTITEIGDVLRRSSLRNSHVKKEFFGLCITGAI